MSLGLIHVVAVGLSVILISFLIYLNIEQVEEYDFLRKELDAKVAELNCKRMQKEAPKQSAPRKFAQTVKSIMGEVIHELMREVNEYFFNEGLLQLGADYCMPECDCKKICQTSQEKFDAEDPDSDDDYSSNELFYSKLNLQDAAVECQKCRLECSKKFQSEKNNMGVGMPKCRYSYTHINYADKHLGAHIVDVQGTPFDCGNFVTCLLGISFGRNPPEYLLDSNMEPGCCFAFNGKASVLISLAKPIFIEVIEITHIDKCRSPTRDTSSAPKDFSIYGLENDTKKEILIGHFIFENTVPSELFTYGSDRTFQVIKAEFKTNHGHPDYTCVYKIGVYGTESK